MTIRDNLQITGAKIDDFCQKYKRSKEDVQLLAVSKKHSVESIRTAFGAGQRAFGENYVQELLGKYEQLKELTDIEWHFIGPLQSNKTKAIAQVACWVHTIERLKIAKRLSDQRPENMEPLNVCIQVNISGEASKSGVSPTEAVVLAKHIVALPNLKLRGIMAIPAHEINPEKQRMVFKKVAQIKDNINKELGYSMDTLSMGMSGDMEGAIAEGATIVRIGTAIFGTREL